MNNIIKKGTIALALVSALSFSLAGCGTANTTKTASANTVTTKTVAQKTSADNQYIVIEPGAKLGSDGKLHDAFINGDIKITQGQSVTLHFLNYDGGEHTYTSADLGLNVKIKGTKTKGQPAETTYTFTPSKTGTFNWMCADPCDGENSQWSMTHQGYMQGTITVLPSTNTVQYVSMVINAGYKLGSDGKLHDAYTPGDITVNSGNQVQLTVYNFDDGTHTLTALDLGVNMAVKGSTQKGNPSVNTYTFTPTKKGSFKWMCANPCDGQNGQWAMTHDNYMNGHINVQ
jgi:plastocyanin